jgi:large subunit ribosomal protein L21
MYALVETSGSQHRVSEGDLLIVDRVQASVGESIELNQVLLIGGDDTKIGTPYVAGAKVIAEVVNHHLGDKVETYKYRRRRSYRKSIGFRARLSTIRIQSFAQ